MWVDYKAVMALLEVSSVIAYRVIRELQAELKQRGFLVNPNAKTCGLYPGESDRKKRPERPER